jgi:hypothetical protein
VVVAVVELVVRAHPVQLLVALLVSLGLMQPRLRLRGHLLLEPALLDK